MARDLTATHFFHLATVSNASTAMQSFISPVVTSMIGVASIAVVFFLVNGGIQYTASSGNPEKLAHAKKVIINALAGLVIVIAAATLTAILSHAYAGSGTTATEKLPSLVAIQPTASPNGLVDVLVSSITGLIKNLVESAAKPFLDGLAFFTHATPLMADNSSVFNLWLAMVGISDSLFVLAIALLGFHVMSFATFGLEEIEFKHMLPKVGLVFLLVNTSIFAIDAVISLSNGMIAAIGAAFPATSVWDTLSAVLGAHDILSLAALLIMLAFLVLAVMLMIYYVLRLVTLYIGAVLSPLVFLLWLLPDFRDFAVAASKTYIATIFVLFIHVVILALAGSILAGMLGSSPSHLPNPLMAMIVGVATILALLKTQGVLSQLSYVSLGPKTATKLGGQLSNAVGHYAGKSYESFKSSRYMPHDDWGKPSRNAFAGINYSDTTRLAPISSPNPGSSRPTAVTSSPKTVVAPVATKGDRK